MQINATENLCHKWIKDNKVNVLSNIKLVLIENLLLTELFLP